MRFNLYIFCRILMNCVKTDKYRTLPYPHLLLLITVSNVSLYSFRQQNDLIRISICVTVDDGDRKTNIIFRFIITNLFVS